MTRPPPSPRRVLVIKWSALGDVAIATAVMEDIARGFPDATLHLNTLPNAASLFEHDPRFDDVFAIDVRAAGAKWRNGLAWLRRVLAGRYDLLIDLQGADRTRVLLSLLALLPGAPPERVGPHAGFPYTRAPTTVPTDAHAIERLRGVLGTLGLPAPTDHPVLHPGPAQLAHVAQLRSQHALFDGDYVVLIPGSHARGALKRWGTERYAELARRLHEAGTPRVVLVGGPDEVDVCRTISALGDYVVNLNGQLQLLEIGPLCEGAAAIVANDTGAAHFAASAQRPLLVLCGPTDPRRVRPLSSSALALQADLPCRNCYAKTCSNPDVHACMKAISPQWLASMLPALRAGELTAGPLPGTGLRLF